MNVLGQVTVSGAHASSNGTYTTLTLAFSAINGQLQTGNNIVITLTASTTETGTAVLNSGTWTSLTIYPTVSGVIIGKTATGILLDINGADNVTIDGRVNQSGDRNLTIQSTAVSSGSYTIRIYNSAENNIIKYCVIKGSGTGSGNGVITFSTAVSGNGNDNNNINNCDITKSSGGSPTNCIYSLGSAGFDNSGNTINNNNFYDHYSASAAIQSAISLSSYSSNFTITGNSFYQSTTVTLAASITLYSIYIANTTGAGYVTIDGNYIGGTSAHCGGTAYTITHDATSRSISFNAIYINSTGTGSVSTVNNNTIKNISLQQSANTVPFRGIYTTSSSWVNIDNNSVGASTGTGSIYIGSTNSAAATAYGIDYNPCTTAGKNSYCSNNTIGGFTCTKNSSSYAINFNAISLGAGLQLNNVILENNIIGSVSTANSIYCNNASYVAQQLNGIISTTGSANVVLNNNTIANLTNTGIGSDVLLSNTIGIRAAGSRRFTVTNNTIHDLKSTSVNLNTADLSSVIGISHIATGSGLGGYTQDIYGNTIYNLYNTNSGSAAVQVCGIYFQGPTAASTSSIYGNFIHSLGINAGNTSAAALKGIHFDNTATAGGGASTIRNIYNNIVSLGTGVNNDCRIWGLYEDNIAERTNIIYFNTVYIGGTAPSTAFTNTYALYNSINTTTRDIRNNIFTNGRSNNSGGTPSAKHYAVYINGTTNLTINYNDYFVSGSGGVLGYLYADRTTFSDWQSATGQDGNSFNTNPVLSNPGGTSADNYRSSVRLNGVSVTGITTDFGGITRATPPQIGAFEMGPSPSVPILVSPADNSTGNPVNINLVWNKSGNASSYNIIVATDAAFLNVVVNDSTLADTVNAVTGLNYLSTYYWKVRAKNSSGWSAFSTSWNFTTIVSLPGTPVLISPLNNASGQSLALSLVWSKIGTASFYNIQLSTDPVFSGLVVNDSTVTDTSKALSNLNPLTSYYWRIRAYNVGGWSVFSSPWSFKTIGNASQVILANPVNGAINQPLTITFRWFKAVDLTLSKDLVFDNNYGNNLSLTVSNYLFEYGTDSTFANVIGRDSLLTDTTKTITGLSNITKYYWRVKAKNQIGWGAFSSAFNLTTIVPVPAAPVLISPVNSSTGNPLSLNLVWNKPQYASGYSVVLASDAGFTNIILNDSTLSDSVKALSSLNALTTYYWKVRAKNTAGWSAFSITYNFRTVGTASTVVLSSPANGAVNQATTLTFKWFKAIDQTILSLKNESNRGDLEVDKPPSISNYWFEYGTDSTFTLITGRDTILTDTLKSVSGLSNVTKYYWRVKAKNQIGWGTYSSAFNLTTIVPLPVAPVLISPPNNATNLAPNNVTLDWGSVLYTATYNVKVANDSLFTSIVFDTSNVVQDSLKLRNGLLSVNGKYYWKVSASNISGTGPTSPVWNFRVNPTGINSLMGEVPTVYKLYNNYPNPFNPVTRIKFDIPDISFVKLVVYDLTGKEVITLVNDKVGAGRYEASWNGMSYSSGVYFVRIEAGDYRHVIRMLLIK